MSLRRAPCCFKENRGYVSYGEGYIDQGLGTHTNVCLSKNTQNTIDPSTRHPIFAGALVQNGGWSGGGVGGRGLNLLRRFSSCIQPQKGTSANTCYSVDGL